MKAVYFRNGQQMVQDVSDSLTRNEIDRVIGTSWWYGSIQKTDEAAIAEANAAGFIDIGECPPPKGFIL